ncbi:MAG: ATP-binding protein [Candidatus Aquirickettsiella gammari]
MEIRKILAGTSLATRAAFLVSTIFILAFGVLAYYSSKIFEENYIALASQNQLTMLRSQADNLNQKLIAAHSTLINAAKNIDQEMLNDEERSSQFLESRTFLQQNFDQGLRLFNAKGHSFVSSQRAKGRVALEALEKSNIIRTINNELPQISRPFANPSDATQTLIAMSVPIFSKDKELIGVMQGVFNLLSKNFAQDLMQTKVGKAGYLYMTTRARIILMHPDKSRHLQLTTLPGQNLGLDKAIEEKYVGVIEGVNSKGLHVLGTYAQIPYMDWVLASNLPMSEVKQAFKQSLQLNLTSAVIVAVLFFALIFFVMRRIMRPVSELTQHLTDLGNGDARQFLRHGQGEIGTMVKAYNQMLKRLLESDEQRNATEIKLIELNEYLELKVVERTQTLEKANHELSATLANNEAITKELIRSEKLAALGKLVAGMAHELNTPVGNSLTVASSVGDFVKQFQSDISGGVSRSKLDNFMTKIEQGSNMLQDNLHRVADLVSSFKQIAVDQTAEHHRSFYLQSIVNDTLSTTNHLIHDREIQLQVEIPASLEMESYPGAIAQLVIILMMNAVTHAFDIGQKGHIWISASVDQDDMVSFIFKDDGLGISEVDQGKIFDPFFTSQLGRSGNGLGLSIAHNIVTVLMGGSIEVHSKLGGGSTFLMRFPRLIR